MKARSFRPAAALLLLSPLALTLAACGSSSDDDASAPTTSPTTTSSASAMPNVQPCDALDTQALSKVLGYEEIKHTGTPAAPSCALTPAVKGGASFTLNYQWWFQGSLDDTLKAMTGNKGTVTHVTVPGADSASLIVQSTKQAAYVTGFVETGKLVELVNGLAKPTDLAKLKAATTEMLAQLSAAAPRS